MAPRPAAIEVARPLAQIADVGVLSAAAQTNTQPDTGRFTGELLVGILDRENPLASEPLGSTIPIQLLAAPGSLKLTDLQVDRIGTPFPRVPVGTTLPEWIPVPQTLVGEVAPFALSFVCAAAGTALIQSIVGSREGG